MAKRKAESMTPEERERNRRLAREESKARCAAAALALMPEAQGYLIAQGAMVPGESVAERLGRLDGFRQRLVQTSAPAAAPDYRPTMRQQQAAAAAGMEEVEF
jgi:hypothetical protein